MAKTTAEPGERTVLVDDETGELECNLCHTVITKIPENHRGLDGKFHPPVPTICVGTTMGHMISHEGPIDPPAFADFDKGYDALLDKEADHDE